MDLDVSKVDLDKLAEAAMNGDVDSVLSAGQTEEVVQEPEGKPEAAKQEDESATSGAAKEPEADEHGTGVSTKDGKGIIPYTVLKETRAKASALQQENEWLKQQLEQLTTQTAQPVTEQEATRSVDDMDAKIASLRDRAKAMADDFPEMSELLTQNADLLAETRKQIFEVANGYRQDREMQEQAQRQAVSVTVQEAIDKIPELAAWQSNQSAEWELALEQDRILRQRPEWADKTFDERFAKVTELVKVLMPNAAPAPTTAPEPAKVKMPSSEQPPVSKPPVNSLSDIPGGVIEARNPAEQVEAMSAAALGNKMMSMSPEQLQEYLSSLGV